MKKLPLKLLLLFSVFFIFSSCDDEVFEDSPLNSTELNSKEESSKTVSTICDMVENQGITSTYFPEIRSITLPFSGGMGLAKNILVLPDIPYFYSTVEDLDLMIENHNDAFDILTVGMTSEQADDYADATGFNEDQPLVDFETQLNFNSLRKKIETQYNIWLNLQGDVFDYTTDPDNHFIEDETERTLLGVRADIIIGDCRNGFTYYRFYDWGYVTVPMDSNFNDVMDVLNELNTGATDQDTVEDIIKNNGIGNTHGEGNPPNIPCSTKLSIHKIEGHMFSNNRYVESKMKFKVPLFEEWNGDQKIFAKTTSFRKKNGKWKKFRANIYAGFYGQLTGYDNCNVFTLTPEGKTKKRKKLKMKKYYVNRSRIQDNNLYAKAMQDGNQVSFDYWD